MKSILLEADHHALAAVADRLGSCRRADGTSARGASPCPAYRTVPTAALADPADATWCGWSDPARYRDLPADVAENEHESGRQRPSRHPAEGRGGRLPAGDGGDA